MPPPKRTSEPGPTANARKALPEGGDTRVKAGALQPRDPATVPEHLRASRDRIYESMMRGGGEPFGPPFSAGIATLTQWVVRKIKQRGFFGFETLERDDADARSNVNKFTRYGAAPFRGDHTRKRKP